MTSSQTRASATSSSPSPRSFLSRLRSPLSSKSRNYTEFYIQSDDPHRHHAPGDVISGTVIIKIVKPLRITHLVVSLHGYAQVFKNPNAPGDAYRTYSSTVGSGKGKKSGSYFGNGFVSLFEDEAVLCGEGRLSEGVYHFNFELEFPSKGLPSSIDFERGTISYMLTATLTRPTTISPTTSCDTKVFLTDSIDVAPVLVPKPRVISLEPISRRTRTKPPRKRPVAATADGARGTSTTSEQPQLGPISENGTTNDHEGPRSPSPSDVSFESQMSSGNASGTEYGIRSVHTIADSSSSTFRNSSRTTLKGKTITATVDVLKGGFLRGDQIPIRVTVNHTKHVRSLKGIIITLYRQARVDMHPALPVAPNSKGDKTKSEDYYPKSRTGLGGLSLSSAGSSHLFRKDLSQSFAPLFVDPRTLTAEVKCTVRVPDEAFPTIANVPGAMISFKYYVEIIVDIQGKLTGLDRMVANAGLVNVPSTAVGGAAREDASNVFSTWGGNFVDTDQIRREKGVISTLFEVIIGTKDSERNGKRKQVEQPSSNDENAIHNIPFSNSNDPYATEGYDDNYYGHDETGQGYDYNYDPAYDEAPGYEQHNAGLPAAYHAHSGSLSSPPEDQGLSEKERLQRAEARLLPSQPPGAIGPSAPAGITEQGIPASAPVLPEDDELYPPQVTAGSSSSTQAHPPPPFRTSSSPALSHARNAPIPQYHTTGITEDGTRPITATCSTTIPHGVQGPSAPSNRNDNETGSATPLPRTLPRSASMATGAAPEYYPSSSSHVQATDDKEELQRRRLEMERSVPPAEHDDEVASQQRPSAPPTSEFQNRTLAPSAPILDDDDEGLVYGMRAGRSAPPPATGERRVSEALPQYER